MILSSRVATSLKQLSGSCWRGSVLTPTRTRVLAQDDGIAASLFPHALQKHNPCRPFSTSSRTDDTASTTSPKYSIAIARHVPKTFPDAISKFATLSSDDGIDLKNSMRQHEKYLDGLRKFVPTLCLPSIDDLPDSLFVEDTVVAIGNRAVITNPGHPSRRGEVDSIRQFLSEQLGMNVTDMRDYSHGQAYCDGGDVLYTSRHLFVGLSERTNIEAVKVLQDALEIDAIPVRFEGNALHLKSVVTHVDSTTLLAPDGSLGDDILSTMEAKERGYSDIVRLPNMLACNVVSVNGGILAQDVGCHKSKAILEDVALERGLDIEFVTCSEVAKADGALTCLSVLLNI